MLGPYRVCQRAGRPSIVEPGSRSFTFTGFAALSGTRPGRGGRPSLAHSSSKAARAASPSWATSEPGSLKRAQFAHTCSISAATRSATNKELVLQKDKL